MACQTDSNAFENMVANTLAMKEVALAPQVALTGWRKLRRVT